MFTSLRAGVHARAAWARHMFDSPFDFSGDAYTGQPHEHRFRVEGVGHRFFRFVDKKRGEPVEHRGSVIVLPDRLVPWSPTTWDDVTERDLGELLVYCSTPQRQADGTVLPLLVVLGTGDIMENLALKVPNLEKAALSRGLFFEVVDTEHACTTFNFLADEGRRVIGAFIGATEEGQTAPYPRGVPTPPSFVRR